MTLRIIGTLPDQVPTNADLGNMAFQDVSNYLPITQMGSRNLLHNGDFRVIQRGTSVTLGAPGTASSNNFFGLDRWQLQRYNISGNFAAAATITQQNDHPLFPGGTCMQVSADNVVTPNNGAVDFAQLYQTIEAGDCVHLHGRSDLPTTLSFWVKTNKVGNYTIQIRAVGGTSGSNPNIVKKYTVYQSGVWEYKTITFPSQNIQAITSNAVSSGMYVAFQLASGLNNVLDSAISNLHDKWYQYSSNGVALPDQANLWSASGNYFKVTDIQYEAGPVATPFERKNYARELEIAQRYYQEFPNSSGSHFTGLARLINTVNNANGNIIAGFTFGTVSMRAAPSTTFYGGGTTSGNVSFYSSSSGTQTTLTVSATSLISAMTSSNAFGFNSSGNISGQTGGSATWMDCGWTGTSVGFVFSAEI